MNSSLLSGVCFCLLDQLAAMGRPPIFAPPPPKPPRSSLPSSASPHASVSTGKSPRRYFHSERYVKYNFVESVCANHHRPPVGHKVAKQPSPRQHSRPATAGRKLESAPAKGHTRWEVKSSGVIKSSMKHKGACDPPLTLPSLFLFATQPPNNKQNAQGSAKYRAMRGRRRCSVASGRTSGTITRTCM